MADREHLIINFDFEEVNSAVFRNAQIHALKKNNIQNSKIHVISPPQFSFLFNQADSVILLDVKEFPYNYREVSEFKEFSRGDAIVNSLLNRIFKYIKTRPIRNFIYTKFYRSARQQKFYVKNGVEKRKLAALKKTYNFKYLRVGDYFDLSNMNVVEFDLSRWFCLQFTLLKEMIADGALYGTGRSRDDLLKQMNDERIRSF